MSWRVLVVGAFACGCGGGKAPANPVPSAEPVALAALAPESIVPADPGHVGVLLPATAIDLAPDYDGKLDRIHVEVGQWVEQGATVATFDPATAQEQLEMARADLRVAKGDAALAAASSRHASQRLQTERALAAQGISAAEAVTDARAERAKAGAASSSAAGRIAAAQARVEQLERQLEETDLAAPFRGQIALVYREAGALAGPTKPVVRLIDPERSFVRFAVPLAQAAGFTRGIEVDVIVEWVPSPLRAIIRDVAPEVDAPTGMVFVEAELSQGSTQHVKPNSPAWVRLHG